MAARAADGEEAHVTLTVLLSTIVSVVTGGVVAAVTVVSLVNSQTAAPEDSPVEGVSQLDVSDVTYGTTP